MATSGLRNRTAGNNWERELVLLFSPLYPNVATSRLVSRLRDSQKIDLAHADEDQFGRFPYNVQAKNYSTLIKYPKLLAELPKIPGVINVLAHKQTKKSGNRFMPVGKYAILEMEDFMKLVAIRKAYEKLSEVKL